MTREYTNNGTIHKIVCYNSCHSDSYIARPREATVTFVDKKGRQKSHANGHVTSVDKIKMAERYANARRR